MTRYVLLFGAVLATFGCNRSASDGSPAAVAAAVSSPAAPAPSAPPTAAAAPEAASVASSTASLLPVGALVPDVSAPAQDGKTVKLRALKGKPVILYFYPKDDTPGCTIEAKGIRDKYTELNKLAVVLGVSTDTAESHKAFADEYQLPFELLDDSSHTLVNAFGVPVTSGHAKRVTFVIDAAGKVRRVFPNVNPDGHAAELIEALKSLS